MTPVVQASILRVAPAGGPEEGLLVLAAPSDAEERIDLRVHLSDNGGATWRRGALVAAGPGAYSDLVALPGGVLGILYEVGRGGPYERIDFTTVGIERLEAADP